MNVTLRRATAEDDEFLFRLYATTRDDVASFGWPPQQAEAFLRMQYNAQRGSYAAAFAAAEHSLVLVDGVPAGRVIVTRAPGEMWLVDISLLPKFRSRGIGTKLIGDVMERCRGERVPLSLHVATSNARARALYERLGFARTGGDAMYDTMRWDKVN